MFGLHLTEVFLVEYEEAGDWSFWSMWIILPVRHSNLLLTDTLYILYFRRLAFGLGLLRFCLFLFPV
jgi:hypothetical protein